jgi:hypothetical protein
MYILLPKLGVKSTGAIQIFKKARIAIGKGISNYLANLNSNLDNTYNIDEMHILRHKNNIS